MTPNPVRTTTQRVVQSAEHVTINQSAIDTLAQTLINQGISSPKWDDIDYLDLKQPEMQLRYLAVLEAHNFCTWHPESDQRWQWEDTDGQLYTGWYGTVKAINHAYHQDIPILDSNYLATFTDDNFYNIYKHKGQWLLLEERIAIFRELGQTIRDTFDNHLITILTQSRGDIRLALGQLIGAFPSFRDTVWYQGQRVAFYKRVQHLLMNIYGRMPAKYTWDKSEMKYLTILADYAVPQYLHHFGVLEYSAELTQHLSTYKEIPSGSQFEVEIRAATIIAGEQILNSLTDNGHQIMPYELDINLWIYAHSLEDEMIPPHRTRSIWY